MSIFDRYECDGQISLFSGFIKEQCDTKPDIGQRLVFHHDGTDYDCIVDAHCGYDFFHVKFIGKMPEDASGYHLSLRGYGKSWDFKEEP